MTESPPDSPRDSPPVTPRSFSEQAAAPVYLLADEEAMGVYLSKPVEEKVRPAA